MEKDRLKFMEDRDGKEGALEFAKRTLVQYRRAVLTSRKRGKNLVMRAFLNIEKDLSKVI